MFLNWDGTFFTALALLGASVIDDLRSRKVHNWLVAAIFAAAVLSSLYLNSPAAIPQMAVSFLAAAIFTIPLYFFKTLGGGDVKLLIAISPLFAWLDFGGLLIYSLFWGAILGLVSVLVRGEIKSFAQNLSGMALKNPIDPAKLHKIPFTVAILFGFLSQHSFPIVRWL